MSKLHHASLFVVGTLIMVTSLQAMVLGEGGQSSAQASDQTSDQASDLGSEQASGQVEPALETVLVQAADTQGGQAKGTAADLVISSRFFFDFSTGETGDTDFMSVTGFFPLRQQPGVNLTYLAASARYGFDEEVSGNLALGHRLMAGNALWGGYLAYDLRNTDFNSFSQIGAGVEAVWDRWDFHLNGYLPVGNTTRQTTDTLTSSTTTTSPGGGSASTTLQGTPFFRGNHLLLPVATTTGSSTTTVTQQQTVNRIEQAMAGVDAEVGVRLIDFPEGGYLRGLGGLYYFNGNSANGNNSGNNGEDAFGGTLGLDMRPNPNLGLGLSVQHDGLFGTQLVFSVQASLSPRLASVKTEANPDAERWMQVAAPISRRNSVVVRQSVEAVGAPVVTSIVTTANDAEGDTMISDVIALNPDRGSSPYVFRHVIPDSATNGSATDGTIEQPLDSIANAINVAQTDDILYVQPTATANDVDFPNGFTLPAGVQLLSTAPSTQLNTQFGLVDLPLSGAGIFPQVGDWVILGDGSSIRGFQLNAGLQLANNVTAEALTILANGNGSSGILANNVGNAVVRNSQITTGTGATGVTLQTVAAGNTLTFENNLVTANGGSVLSVDAIAGSVTFTGGSLTSTGASSQGIQISNSTGAVNLSDVEITITNPGGDGIQILDSSGGVAIAATPNSTITAPTDDGLSLENSGNINISGFTLNEAGDVGVSGSGLTQLTLDSNTISQARNQGIFLENSDGTFNLTNNTITDVLGTATPVNNATNEGQGITINEVTGTLTIANNTIMGTAASNGTAGNLANPLDDNGQGIVILNTAAGTLALDINSNNISNNFNDAILLSFIGPAQISSLTIQGNTISNNGGIAPTRGDGIGLLSNTAIQGFLIDNNIISGQGDDGIDIRIVGLIGSSNLVGTIQNNTLSNNSGDGILVSNQAPLGGGNSKTCLDFIGNSNDQTYILSNSFATALLQFFRNNNTGTFNPSANVTESGSAGNFSACN